MKIIISYPPLSNQKGYQTLGQNHQSQFFKEPIYIYPVVPAIAATLLSNAGHEVIWNDCIAGGLSYRQFLDFIQAEKPDLIAFETQTAVIKQYWKIIDDIKGLIPGVTVPKIVLFGGHVTALPEESFQNSQVDFVLAGADYDFLLLNLCQYLDSENREPRIENRELEPGIYYREDNQIKSTGQFQLNHDLNTLPFIDRDLTKWKLYSSKNGNYKRTPVAFIMSGRPALYPKFRSRSANNVLNEIGTLIYRYKIREIMDDSGFLPIGDWLREFCNGMISTGYNKKIYLDCNMCFGAHSGEDYKLMKKSGFRLILFGLESANQNTLDRINKNLKVQDIIEGCKLAAKYGLYPHITIMFGYPWETYEEALNTLRLGKWLLNKGYAYTMQAAMAMPYPGTILFEESKQKGWLRTLNWDDYDMKQPVIQTSIPDNKIMELVEGMNRVSFNPGFILRKLFFLKR